MGFTTVTSKKVKKVVVNNEVFTLLVTELGLVEVRLLF